MENIDSLRKEAKRWLRALRAGDLDALARFRQVYPDGSAEPVLREVQHALTREAGYAGWIELTHTLEGTPPVPDLVRLEILAAEILLVYQIGMRKSSAGLARCSTSREALTKIIELHDLDLTPVSAASTPDCLPEDKMQPVELRATWPMELQGGVYSTTTEV